MNVKCYCFFKTLTACSVGFLGAFWTTKNRSFSQPMRTLWTLRTSDVFLRTLTSSTWNLDPTLRRSPSREWRTPSFPRWPSTLCWVSVESSCCDVLTKIWSHGSLCVLQVLDSSRWSWTDWWWSTLLKDIKPNPYVTETLSTSHHITLKAASITAINSHMMLNEAF